MRKQIAKGTNKKINRMKKDELLNFIKALEANNQKNSHVYASAIKQLRVINSGL
jgi:hypothetical protein